MFEKIFILKPGKTPKVVNCILPLITLLNLLNFKIFSKNEYNAVFYIGKSEKNVYKCKTLLTNLKLINIY